MQWVLLAVIVGALLYLSRFYPKIAFSVLGVLAVGAGVVVLTTTDIADINRSKLPTEDIVIENPVMSAAYAGSYRFNARMLNTNDKETLKEAVISITMFDCPGEANDDCAVIGQEDERIILKIPPGQARDISQTISFDASQPKGTVRWEFSVTGTRS